MEDTRLTYTFRSDASLETELDVLAAIYCFVLFESEVGKKVTERASGSTAPTTTEVSKQGRRLPWRDE